MYLVEIDKPSGDLNSELVLKNFVLWLYMYMCMPLVTTVLLCVCECKRECVCVLVKVQPILKVVTRCKRYIIYVLYNQLKGLWHHTLESVWVQAGVSLNGTTGLISCMLTCGELA